MKSTNINNKIDNIVKWLNKFLKQANAKGIVFGVSGGIDSAVIAAISNKYFPDKHLALSMNINNSKEDVNDAMLVINHFNLNYKKINLEPTYKKLTKALGTDSKTFGNIKSRLRMISLYSFAQENNYLVVGTSNHIEMMIGYFTKYGDSGSDVIPLANLLKKDVKEIATFLGVPEKIINKKPSAGLYENQTDEDEIGLTYDQMDSFFENRSDVEVSLKMKKMIKTSEHKRNIPKSPLPINKLMK